MSTNQNGRAPKLPVTPKGRAVARPRPLPAAMSPLRAHLHGSGRQPPNAIVYCEGKFGRIDGKTANGLVRHCDAYRILSVIDGTKAGRDSGEVLDGAPNGIPVLADLDAAIHWETVTPDVLIYGKAPSTGRLSQMDRGVILGAISQGINIVSGLHEYLGDDPEISAAADASHVWIRDVRRPRPAREMRLFDGSVSRVGAIRIAVLGTDCAIGKRTTATILTQALRAAGIGTELVGTGQTGLMQGGRWGVAMDAVPPQFCAGELEGAVLAAWEAEAPQVIVIEGQGALSHPAFCTSALILRGSQPDGVSLQHAPARAHRCDFPQMPMPDPADEIAMIEAFAPTRVIGLTVNHEGLAPAQIAGAIKRGSDALALPATDALTRPPAELVDMVLSAFPGLGRASPVYVA